jgi:hypothetical protein
MILFSGMLGSFLRDHLDAVLRADIGAYSTAFAVEPFDFNVHLPCFDHVNHAGRAVFCADSTAYAAGLVYFGSMGAPGACGFGAEADCDRTQ